MTSLETQYSATTIVVNDNTDIGTYVLLYYTLKRDTCIDNYLSSRVKRLDIVV